MPYRRPGSTRLTGSIGTGNPLKSNRQMSTLQSPRLRHQYAQAITGFASMLPGVYSALTIARFVRNDGVTDDTPPSATASNNLQSNKVMNGSRIQNAKVSINMKSSSASTAFDIDVYEVATSFYDVLVWNTIIPTSCPLTYDSTTTGPPNKQGEVSAKTPTATLITRNNFANYRILQHYMRRLGTVHFTASDGGDNTAVLTLTRIPPKVRRSNQGMYWGLFFVNDSDANNAGTFTGVATAEISFDEIRSDNYLPFIV